MVILRCKSRRDCLWDVGTGNTAVTCHMVEVGTSKVQWVASLNGARAEPLHTTRLECSLCLIASTALRFDLVMV